MGDVDFIVEPIMAASGFEQLLEILSVHNFLYVVLEKYYKKTHENKRYRDRNLQMIWSPKSSFYILFL